MVSDEYRGRHYEPTDISVDHPLARELRIPLVSSPHPRWFYVTAVVVSTEPHLWHGLMPTDDELRVVASFHEQYCDHWYRESFRDVMREFAPYDIDGGAVGRYLIKHAHGGWGFRRHTWQSGPEFVPEWNEEPVSVVAALDRYHGHVPDRWETWKAGHADVFAAVTTS